MSIIKKELKEMNEILLTNKVEELRREYFYNRFSVVTSHIKDYSQFKKLRKNLARALTFLNQKSLK